MKNIVFNKTFILKIASIIGILFIISGCSNKGVDSTIENSQIEKSFDEDIERDNGKSDNITKQDVISDESEIIILNFLQDGTFWATEGEYIIHADIHGNIISKALCNKFGSWIECGIDNHRLVSKKDDAYHVFDIETEEDVTEKYTGDYEEIDNIFRTENGVVFSIRKSVESFEEDYDCFKLVSETEDILFEVSLDTKTLLNEYGIKKDDMAHPHVGYCSNNVYYIPYIGEYEKNTLNSLIIDLNKTKVISAPFPHNNGLYISSDGDYTLIYSQMQGNLVVNNETSDFTEINFTDGYYPDDDGKLSEHKFLAKDGYTGRAILDVQGNIVIDLNNYERSASSRCAVSPFVDDTAFIRFEGGYYSFIDSKGKILFDPIKGN